MALLNSTMRWVLGQRMNPIRKAITQPHTTQAGLLNNFLQQSHCTDFGKKHFFKDLKNAEDFAQSVSVADYESLKPYIQQMMLGEPDVLWAGQVHWFAKSSGTTSDKSKFIPVTDENLYSCHLKGGWDTTTMIYDQRPDSTFFDGKLLIMGGSYADYEPFPTTQVGDVSAVMMSRLPYPARTIYVPSVDVGLLPNTEDKIERMAHELVGCDLRMLGGVPTWTIVLLRRLLEITKKSHIKEVFPNLKGYIHGGVSFTPYREQFEQLIPDKDFIYWEIYNASEGFFASQNEFGADDMLLLLDNGIYYEFLPESEWHSLNPKAISLSEVEIGKQYAPLITTNAGLWRYMTGDTIVFTSLSPYKIKVSGRTNQFINAFGEEVMVANTDKALADTCHTTGATVSDYTVAPIYFDGTKKGGHQWLIEFETEPQDLDTFNTLLDQNLQRINSDYEAKRFKSMAMERLHLQQLPKGTFHTWLKSKGKFGGQYKVPRLANHRQYVEEILVFLDNRF